MQSKLVVEDFILILYLFLLSNPSFNIFFAKGPFTEQAVSVSAFLRQDLPLVEEPQLQYMRRLSSKSTDAFGHLQDTFSTLVAFLNS